MSIYFRPLKETYIFHSIIVPKFDIRNIFSIEFPNKREKQGNSGLNVEALELREDEIILRGHQFALKIYHPPGPFQARVA